MEINKLLVFGSAALLIVAVAVKYIYNKKCTKKEIVTNSIKKE